MKSINYILAATLVISGSACKKDLLNVDPATSFGQETVWSDPALMETAVNNVYLGVPHGFSNIMMSSMVDETSYNADFGTSNVTKSLVTPSDYSIFDESYWTG